MYLCTLCVWLPQTRDLWRLVTEGALAVDGFLFATALETIIGKVRDRAFRISYVVELSWKIYAPTEQGQRLWDILRGTGQEHRVNSAGIGV